MFINWSRFNMPYKERYIKNKIPAVAGIYVLYVQLENEKWDCFYIGNTENLHNAMMQHLDEKENPKIKENIQDYVCGFEYAPLEEAEARASVSKYLFDKLKPDCMEDPGGNGIRVNIARVGKF
ncbi:MAG TPA: GIY-YIG nuclease family protein [Phaeodactylibacter sp.]|nr:GIY-YIG nuclease family protein [Phaeodactylibacter sp.]